MALSVRPFNGWHDPAAINACAALFPGKTDPALELVEQGCPATAGSMAVRFQPDPAEPLTFIDVKASTQASPATCCSLHGSKCNLTCQAALTPLQCCGGWPHYAAEAFFCFQQWSRLSSAPVLQADQKARLRFCWFDTSNSYGIFATMPLLAQSSAPEPSLGMRYSTPQTSAGAIVQPVSARLDAAWWVSPLQAGHGRLRPGGSTPSAYRGAGCMSPSVTKPQRDSVMLQCSCPARAHCQDTRQLLACQEATCSQQPLADVPIPVSPYTCSHPTPTISPIKKDAPAIRGPACCRPSSRAASPMAPSCGRHPSAL